jgi:general secretion pathway protein G
MRVAARAASFRAARRAASRGLTLVELVIVITIIGVITAAIAIGVIRQKQKADIGATATFCSTLRQATLSWKATHPGEDCPTPEMLKKEKEIDATANLKDPFGGGYKISCEGDEITVSSPGPDKKPGTDDDIIVPKPASQQTK